MLSKQMHELAEEINEDRARARIKAIIDTVNFTIKKAAEDGYFEVIWDASATFKNPAAFDAILAYLGKEGFMFIIISCI